MPSKEGNGEPRACLTSNKYVIRLRKNTACEIGAITLTPDTPGAPGLSEWRLQPLAHPQVARWHIHVALWLSSSIFTDRLSSLLLPPLHFGQGIPLY